MSKWAKRRAFEHARAYLTVQDARAKHAAIDGVAEFSNETLMMAIGLQSHGCSANTI